MTTRYVVPPEHCVFTRGDRDLHFDPANFIWFVTDHNGTAIVDCLSRYATQESAVKALSDLIRRGASRQELQEYVTSFIESLVAIGFLHVGKYHPLRLPSGLAEHYDTLYLHLTSRCNLRCTYCYNQYHRREILHRIDISDVAYSASDSDTEAFLKVIDEATDLGFTKIKLTGGEATLHKDFLRIAAHAKSRGLSVNLLTNGTTITPSFASAIADVVDSVSLSIDSDKPEKHDAARGRGSFHKAVTAYRLLRSEGVRFIHVNAVITPLNIDSVGSFLAFATDILKADNITVAASSIAVPTADHQYPHKNQLSAQQFRQIYDQNREFSTTRSPKPKLFTVQRFHLFRRQCGAANGIISVDANGDVYPCQTMHLEPFKCGNAFTSGLGAVLNGSSTIQTFRKTVVDALPGCKTCPVRYLCGGGCRSEAYTNTGNLLALNQATCSTSFAKAVDKLWDAATIPVQDAVQNPQSSGTSQPLTV